MKMREKKGARSERNTSFCDLTVNASKSKKFSPKSTVYRYRGNFTWKGIKTEAYKQKKGQWSKIIRRVLVGADHKAKSHVRYFEIEPGGRSSLEKHRHEHIVIVLRGTGKVFLGYRSRTVRFLDVVYITPNTPHQFINTTDEPFGFLCIVSAKRDRPTELCCE